MNLAPALTGAAIDAAVATGWVCFDPNHLFPGDEEAALVFFADCALQISDRLPGRKFFVVDELGSFISGNSIPKRFKHFVRVARRYGIDCVWMAQGPNGINTAVRDQLTEVVCHRLDDTCSLDFPLQRGFSEKELRALPLRQYQPGAKYYWISRDQLGREARGD
ncbi:MAG: hypothetical protein SFU86_00020 [Pirellulaceae bacterium]|nr:hypothetical protein [Pirellulaceae bacterium]